MSKSRRKKFKNEANNRRETKTQPQTRPVAKPQPATSKFWEVVHKLELRGFVVGAALAIIAAIAGNYFENRRELLQQRRQSLSELKEAIDIWFIKNTDAFEKYTECGFYAVLSDRFNMHTLGLPENDPDRMYDKSQYIAYYARQKDKLSEFRRFDEQRKQAYVRVETAVFNIGLYYAKAEETEVRKLIYAYNDLFNYPLSPTEFERYGIDELLAFQDGELVAKRFIFPEIEKKKKEKTNLVNNVAEVLKPKIGS